MKAHLNTHSNFHREGLHSPRSYAAGDSFYQILIDAHRGLSDADSQRLNARLVLLLANHIGDLVVIEEALVAARAGLDEQEPKQKGPLP